MPVGDVINDLMRDDDNLDFTYRWFKDRTTQKPAFEKKEQDWMITYAKDYCKALNGVMFVPHSEAEFFELSEPRRLLKYLRN